MALILLSTVVPGARGDPADGRDPDRWGDDGDDVGWPPDVQGIDRSIGSLRSGALPWPDLSQQNRSSGAGAAALALVPGLDQTRTVGLVTLPGAFVGVLLAGASP